MLCPYCGLNEVKIGDSCSECNSFDEQVGRTKRNFNHEVLEVVKKFDGITAFDVREVMGGDKSVVNALGNLTANGFLTREGKPRNYVYRATGKELKERMDWDWFIGIWENAQSLEEIVQVTGMTRKQVCTYASQIRHRKGIDLQRFRNHRNHEDRVAFIKAWQSSRSPKEVSTKLNGMPISTVCSMAYYLKRKGVPLKSFRTTTDWKSLIKVAKVK